MSAPRDTLIYYSKRKNTVYLILCILAVMLTLSPLAGKYFSKKPDLAEYIGDNFFLILIVVISIIGAVAAYFKQQNIKNKSAQIIISDNGISLISPTDEVSYILYSWSEIEDEKISLSTKTNSHYLTFSHATGSEKISLEPLAIKPLVLEKLLRNYRFGLII